jgi:uncharacterized protein YpmS
MMKKPIILIFITMLLIGLACQLPFQFARQTSATSSQFSPEAAETVEKLFTELESQTGQFAFTITEEELTSYLTLKLDEKQDGFTVDNIQTTLDDNLITITADLYASTLGIKVPGELIITADTDIDGNLVFSLDSINLGALSLSNSLEETIGTAVNESLTNNISNQLVGVSIDTIYIDNGMMTISGTKY